MNWKDNDADLVGNEPHLQPTTQNNMPSFRKNGSIRPKRIRKPKAADRNKGVQYTIQQLKADHKEAGGHFFAEDNMPKVRTHGHPVRTSNGTFFVGSSLAHGERSYTVYSMAGDKVKPSSGPWMTQARAMQEANS